MVDSYKNIERLRYRINKDLLAICSEVKKDNESKRVLFIDECFSAVLSTITALFLTQSTLEPVTSFVEYLCKKIWGEDILTSVISIISAVICIIILMVASVIIKKLLLFLKNRKRNKALEGIDTIDYVKEFDNIACDSILVAMEYKQMFLETCDENEKTLYYLESVHYLESASLITERLCMDKRNIKTPKNVLGVDIYRINNIKAVMTEVCNFLKDKSVFLSLNEDDKNDVKKQLEVVETTIKNIDIL